MNCLDEIILQSALQTKIWKVFLIQYGIIIWEKSIFSWACTVTRVYFGFIVYYALWLAKEARATFSANQK